MPPLCPLYAPFLPPLPLPQNKKKAVRHSSDSPLSFIDITPGPQPCAK